MSDLIKRADAIREICLEGCNTSPDVYECGAMEDGTCEIINRIKALPSADAVPQSEQYKKGFEDAKRAFLVEYARESENMRKRNAQLEVMLNAQKAISADSVKVVRCKDCKWWGGNKNTEHNNHICNRALNQDVDYWTRADDFCSYGERREP